MIVKELIEKLKKYNENEKVLIEEYGELFFQNIDRVFWEGEDDPNTSSAVIISYRKDK